MEGDEVRGMSKDDELAILRKICKLYHYALVDASIVLSSLQYISTDAKMMDFTKVEQAVRDCLKNIKAQLFSIAALSSWDASQWLAEVRRSVGD